MEPDSKADLLIDRATIVDGSGNPARQGQVAITGGRIVAVGDALRVSAKRILDIAGLVVCPGFIDVHTHDDLYLTVDPAGSAKLRQGVTTVLVGNCGSSPAPTSEEYRSEVMAFVSRLGAKHTPPEALGLSGLGAFLDYLETRKPTINVAALVGHSTVRLAAMGWARRKPTPTELRAMAAMVEQAMSEGAFGVSTGLIYPPGAYAEIDELTELARAAAGFGGFYATHLRNECDQVIQSLKEALTIGRRADLPVLISHHKTSGRANWGRSAQTLELIERSRTAGQKVYLDQYPYTASSTALSTILPPEALESGPEVYRAKLREDDFRNEARSAIEGDPRPDWENVVRGVGYGGILIASSASRPEWAGRSLSEIALDENRDPLEIAFDLIRDDEAPTRAIFRSMDEGDVARIMQYPYGMIGSDGLAAFNPDDRVHPRFYGTFPRVLGRYVREKGVLSQEEAVRKMTSLPAQLLGLHCKGLIREGFDADLVIFDPATVVDQAEFGKVGRPPEGIAHVLVNGDLAVEQGRITGHGKGQVLRRH